MRAQSHTTGPRHTLMRKCRHLVTRWWFWAVIGVAVIVVAGGPWVGVHGLQAKAELESAQTLMTQLKAQALDQDIAGATTTYETLRAHSAKAQELTNDQIWRAAEVVPVLGRNLTAVRELAAVTNTVVTDAIDLLLQVASMITPASLAPKVGAIDLAPFRQAVAR